MQWNPLSLSQVAIQIHFRISLRLCRVLNCVTLPDLCLEVIDSSILCLDRSVQTTELS